MIFYLSGTGNTHWAASYICDATGDRMVNIADAIKGNNTYTLDKDERIGFCFPEHGWRPPVLVIRFIEDINIVNPD